MINLDRIRKVRLSKGDMIVIESVDRIPEDSMKMVAMKIKEHYGFDVPIMNVVKASVKVIKKATKRKAKR
jgi:hypothetical protein